MSQHAKHSSRLTVRLLLGSAALVLILVGDGMALDCQAKNGAAEAISTSNPQVQAQTGGVPQTLCPVTGDRIDRSQYTDYQGKRVYFCCAACKKPFAENSEKYIREMESSGVVLEKVPSGPVPAPGQSGQ